ncbi:MAG: hypothetical protein CMO11_04830 [Thaumarchaeota archaeon]|nr:hypothetical protein [Nitrososphaerota archaeon]|tara:strand:+ start:2642 stop:2845 length:204 start_codon:yes stop_codon:yes gene_type:complete
MTENFKQRLDSDLVFRLIGFILILIGMLLALYTSDTSTLASQIVPIYYFISVSLIAAGFLGLISVLK